MRKALEAARAFIVNGAELGGIHKPDTVTPNEPHNTLAIIDAALALPAVESPVATDEVGHLVRFLANTWAQIDDFVYENCNDDQLAQYPVIQGTANQIRIRQIGGRPYENGQVAKGIKLMLSATQLPASG